MWDALLDALLDTIKIVPFLIVAFTLIELTEEKVDVAKHITHTQKYGPLLGGLLGMIPQCGISVLGTNLYLTGMISMGTLLSIYLSTSDEMIPILLTENISIEKIIPIVFYKALIGIVAGFLIDILFKKNTIHNDLCKVDDCSCENSSIVKAVAIHVIKITLFIGIMNILLNIIFFLGLEDYLNALMLKGNFFSPFVTSFIGLIPNCASSVVITKLYVSGSINYAALLSGLLTNAGVGLLILFKNNQDKKNTLLLIILLYLIGAFSGLLINLLFF